MAFPARMLLLLPAAFLASAASRADEPLHTRIDALITAKAAGRPAAALADDAEFLRRAYLDLAGRIPSVAEARAFLDDKAPDKRTKRIDRLLNGPEYARRMQELFHVMFMERLGDHPEWARYLQKSFEANKPWDQLAREILNPVSDDEALKGAAFFYARRLEKYGENPVDYPGLTRDVGRLFLGKDLRCAECHDHLFIAEYKQEDFQGLFTIFRNTTLVDPKKPAVGEQLMTKKLDFISVFRQKDPKSVGPRVPGGKEIEIPAFAKGEEYLKAPDKKTRSPGVPRFSPLAALAEQLATADNRDFSRNIANRLWFVLMGRGLVHPLDLHHAENPPSHPELLDLLAKELVAHQFDIKWLLRELALSQTYQRSSVLPKDVKELPPESFLVAHEKRLSAEQLMASMLEAAGQRERVGGEKGGLDAVRAKFVKAFANPEREPEEEFNASLKAALFVLNDDLVLSWLTPQPGNLIERLSKRDDDKVAEEMYLSVLTRRPTDDEQREVADYLKKNAGRRVVALGHLAWALLASTEFGVNH